MEIIQKIKEYITDNIEHLIIILLIIACLGLIIWNSFYNTERLEINSNNIVETEESEETEETLDVLTVDIKGYVVNPGVYEVDNGLNINDLIQIAGGIRRGGTTRNINLSHKLSDQMVIIIHSERQLRTLQISNTATCDSYNIINCVDNDTSIVERGPTTPGTSNITSGSTVPAGKVSINNGTKEQLMTLTGIGEARALAIIQHRTTHGPFLTLEDIMNVSGIGQSIFDNIKENITL